MDPSLRICVFGLRGFKIRLVSWSKLWDFDSRASEKRDQFIADSGGQTFCRYQQVCFIGTVDGKVQKPIVELSAYWMIARVESMQQGHKGQMDTEYNEAE